MTIIANNDPNNKWGKHAVEVVLKCWEYAASFSINVVGNCHGFDVMQSAISQIYDGICDGRWPDSSGVDDDTAWILLRHPTTGQTLQCIDEDGREESWLEEMVVSLQIANYTPPENKQATVSEGEGQVRSER